LGSPLVNAAHKTLKKSTPVSGFQGKKQTWQFSTPSSRRKKWALNGNVIILRNVIKISTDGLRYLPTFYLLFHLFALQS